MSATDAEQQQLFQDILLEHGQHPRCAGIPTNAQATREAHDPHKGDRVRIGLLWEGDALAAIGFEASGSTVLKASCSLLCESLLGTCGNDARRQVARTLAMLVDPGLPVKVEDWGEIAALSAIRRFPARVQCASMPWRVAEELLREA